jgi:hypothetical protein
VVLPLWLELAVIVAAVLEFGHLAPNGVVR